MDIVRWIISTAPEIFLLLAVAAGTILGRARIYGFSLGTTACTLIVAVLIGQLGSFAFPPVLRVVLFSLFVFMIGYKSGPEFYAALSIRTLAQVAMALLLGGTGLVIVQEANFAAGYAVTYVLGYILTLIYVPFVAPKLMGVNLKDEAKKLEIELAGGEPPKTENLHYRKFQARAYRVSTAAGRSVKAMPGNVINVLVDNRDLHGRSIQEVADRMGNTARGVFLRTLTRMGREVPPSPETRIYVGDVMTLVGTSRNIERATAHVGQILRSGDRTDIAFLAAGIAAGLLASLVSFKARGIALTLGGGWRADCRPRRRLAALATTCCA